MKPEQVQIAAMLRQMREGARVTREEAAEVLGCTRSKIGDLETGRSRPKPAELERLLDHYGVIGPERDKMIEFARATHPRRRQSPYISPKISASVRRAVDLEAQAISALFYSGELIPGLLQIPAYASALVNWGWSKPPDDTAQRVALRMTRATVLTRTDRPPLRYWCILGEAALRTNIGGPMAMRQQIKHLIDQVRELSNLVIQILPFSSGPHHFLGLTVTLNRFLPPTPDRLIMESYEREIVRDDPAEVFRATHHLDLVRAMALSPKESIQHMERTLQELFF